MKSKPETTRYVLDPDTSALHSEDGGKPCSAAGSHSFEVWVTDEVAKNRQLCSKCAPVPELTAEEHLIHMLTWSAEHNLAPEETAQVLIRNGSKLQVSFGTMYSRMMANRDKRKFGRPHDDFSPFLGFSLPPTLITKHSPSEL